MNGVHAARNSPLVKFSSYAGEATQRAVRSGARQRDEGVAPHASDLVKDLKHSVIQNGELKLQFRTGFFRSTTLTLTKSELAAAIKNPNDAEQSRFASAVLAKLASSKEGGIAKLAREWTQDIATDMANKAAGSPADRPPGLQAAFENLFKAAAEISGESKTADIPQRVAVKAEPAAAKPGAVSAKSSSAVQKTQRNAHAKAAQKAKKAKPQAKPHVAKSGPPMWKRVGAFALTALTAAAVAIKVAGKVALSPLIAVPLAVELAVVSLKTAWNVAVFLANLGFCYWRGGNSSSDWSGAMFSLNNSFSRTKDLAAKIWK